MPLSLEERLAAIEDRNKRVESDKAWEISLTRRLFVAFVTYVVVGLTLFLINMPHPWVNAVIPVLGYALSTLTLPFIRQLWQNRGAKNVKS